LVLTQRDQDDVAVVDPDLFPELAADKTESLDAIKALQTASVTIRLCLVVLKRCIQRTYHGLKSAIPEHFYDLRIFLPLLLECEFALLVAISNVSDR
jgi:hypothetical protein